MAYNNWEKVKLCLNKIEFDAAYASYYAKAIERIVEEMTERPEFLTRAEAEIDTVIKLLSQIIEILERCKTNYLALPAK